VITPAELLKAIATDTPFQPATSVWRAVELARVIQSSLPEGRGLDVGCGDGQVLKRVLEHIGSREMVGIDLDPRETAAAEALGLYTKVYTGSAAQVPEPDECFDFAFSNSVLEHIPDLGPVFAEVSRVLKPGGAFVFTVPSTTFDSLLYGPLFPWGARKSYEKMIDQRLAHCHYFSPENCTNWLDPAGLTLESSTPYLFRKAVRRWEFIARMTSGILYQLAGKRRQPIELQHALKIRSRRKGVLARLAIAGVMLLADRAVQDDENHDLGPGCYLFVARKPLADTGGGGDHD
jgi:SAM-dependent methyltransferase